MNTHTLNQRESDRAVSPVIGVILMVAITVVLAAVIGVFVLGLGDEVSSTAPSVTLDFDESSNEDQFVLEHGGGDTLDSEELSLLINGEEAEASSHTFDPGADWNFDELDPGETATVNIGIDGGSGDFDVSIRHDPSGTVIGSIEDLTIDSIA